MMQQDTTTPIPVKPIEKYCFCNVTNHQCDAEVILPDNSRYCMLCGHKKRANSANDKDTVSSTKPKDGTDAAEDDDDDVVIVKEEKRRGVLKRKRDSSDGKHVGLNDSQNNKKSVAEDAVNGLTWKTVRVKSPAAITTSNLSDKSKLTNSSNVQTKNVKKPEIIIKSAGCSSFGNSFSKISFKTKAVVKSKIEKQTFKLPKNIINASARAENAQANVTNAKPKIKVIHIEPLQSEFNGNNSKKQATLSKVIMAKESTETAITDISKKNVTNKTSKTKSSEINQSEVRKSKRAKKASSRFTDCVTVNLDTVSESSDSTDSADTSSEDDSDDDGYASPLDMLDEENICKVCMSYEPPIEFEMGCDVASFELKWIDCDSCHRWFHWFCVGIFDENDTQFFKCKPCRTQSA